MLAGRGKNSIPSKNNAADLTQITAMDVWGNIS